MLTLSIGFVGEKSQREVTESNEGCPHEDEEVSSGHDHILEEVGQRTGMWWMALCASGGVVASFYKPAPKYVNLNGDWTSLI